MEEARGAAGILGRFFAENCETFPYEEQFALERVTAKLSKMMIARLGQRVQQPLTAFYQ